jgi:putative protein-disulfide isomerase
MTEPERPRLIYFADTMCSWCYGFAPEMNRVLLEMGEEVDLVLQSGGLRPFNTEVLTDEMKPRFRGYRQAVADATGLLFDDAFFKRDGFIMDTEPASRAVVTMRNLSPQAAYPFMHQIQRAFFARNEDIRDADVLSAHAEAFEVPGEEFAAAFASDEMKEATRQDFALAQRFQVTGFPTLVLLKGRAGYHITVGYAKAEVVIENLRRALAHQPEGVS